MSTEAEFKALKELAIIDGLLFSLMARAAKFEQVEVVVVMPGVFERARVLGALEAARRLKSKRFICTGTNLEERENGELYNEELIDELWGTVSGVSHPLFFRIEVDEVGNHARMQSMNAAKRLVAEPPTGIVLQTGGSWHTPRSYLTLIQACVEVFSEAELILPRIYPLLVDTCIGSQIKAASKLHKQSGYTYGIDGLVKTAEAEVDRRLTYTDKGHLVDLEKMRHYMEHLLES